MREQPLLLGRARLGLLFELNAKLGFLRFTDPALFLFSRRTLFGETRLFLSSKLRRFFLTPSLRRFFFASSRFLGSLQPRVFLGCNARFLNRLQLQELVRQ